MLTGENLRRTADPALIEGVDSGEGERVKRVQQAFTFFEF